MSFGSKRLNTDIWLTLGFFMCQKINILRNEYGRTQTLYGLHCSQVYMDDGQFCKY